MSRKERSFTYAFITFAIGTALVLLSAVGARAADAIDDPVRQPHFKNLGSNIIPNTAKRFVVLADFNNQVVLDRETGLVWEESIAGGPGVTWAEAGMRVSTKTLAARRPSGCHRSPNR